MRPPDGDNAGAHHHPTKLPEHLRPDHQVGDSSLIPQGDEHYAFGAAGPLTNENETGRL
jgi:hypothetical protein